MKMLLSAAGSTVLYSCGPLSGRPRGVGGRRMLVLAFDGLDPGITRQLMDAGRMPNFAHVAARGSFKKIATSTPPQTPVAFSNIISGTDPGTHGIFDFIHRDPKIPRLEGLRFAFANTTAGTEWAIPFTRWQLPVSGGEINKLRRGPEFWNPLVKAGRDVMVYEIPTTYPPPTVEGKGSFRCISGMGTPDIHGTLGLFTVYATDEILAERGAPGGRFVRLDMRDHHATATIQGPENFLLRPKQEKQRNRQQTSNDAEPKSMAVDFTLARDPTANVAKIEIADKVILLKQGEWSDWVQIDFETGIPGSTVLSAMQAPTSMRGMVRFCLKQVHPHLKLYMSPINIDPTEPANPISTPHDFARQVARSDGLYYTTGIPEDAKALRSGGLNEDEFLAQANLVLEERIRHFRHGLADFRQGCMFSYFGTSDLIQHMFWRDRDLQHPGRLAEQGDRYAGVIEDFYVRMDQLVGEGLAKLDDSDTLMVLSDHGFTTFRRQVSINTWLVEADYMRLQYPFRSQNDNLFLSADWNNTRAYAVGLNALYINQWNREEYGVVNASEKQALMEKIAEELLELKDKDADNAKVIERIDLVSDIYPNADPMVAPDMIIGYADGYRFSWATALGGIPRQLIEDNLDRWSGTHCIAADLMPGILVTNRTIVVDDPSVTDVAPTILGAFGVTPPPEMTGRNMFAPV